MAAHRDDLPLLQDAQKLGLKFGRQLADLVQEDGSLVCRAETSQGIMGCARKCPFEMAEHVAGKQRAGD